MVPVCCSLPDPSVPLLALVGEREDRGWNLAFGALAPRLPGPAPELLPEAWVFQPSLWPPGSVALALSAGPPRSHPPCLALPPGMERASPPPPLGPPPGPGSWQPAGGSLSMLHLFIDRALPQLLFQSSASCRRLIREGGAGSRPRAVTQGWEGTQRARLSAQLSFLSPERSAIPRSWGLGKGQWSDAPLEGSWACSSGASWLLLPPGVPRPDEAPPHGAGPSSSGLREPSSRAVRAPPDHLPFG